MTIHPSVKPGDRVRVTIETTVVRISNNPASNNGTPAWTNLAFAEHTAELRTGDPGPSYFTLELPDDMVDTTVHIHHVEDGDKPLQPAALDALDIAIERAKFIADRDKYSPQEAAAAWDVVDALMTLRSAREHVTPDHDQDDRDGKQISRAAEAEEHTDECD